MKRHESGINIKIFMSIISAFLNFKKHSEKITLAERLSIFDAKGYWRSLFFVYKRALFGLLHHCC